MKIWKKVIDLHVGYVTGRLGSYLRLIISKCTQPTSSKFETIWIVNIIFGYCYIVLVEVSLVKIEYDLNVNLHLTWQKRVFVRTNLVNAVVDGVGDVINNATNDLSSSR